MANLERAGLVCVPVRQNTLTLGKACEELERRLKSGSIRLPTNPALRAHASEVEVFTDATGLKKPIKPGAKDNYAGRRGAKIDGIVSLVIAIAEALRHEMATDDAALANWTGEVLFL